MCTLRVVDGFRVEGMATLLVERDRPVNIWAWEEVLVGLAARWLGSRKGISLREELVEGLVGLLEAQVAARMKTSNPSWLPFVVRSGSCTKVLTHVRSEGRCLSDGGSRGSSTCQLL